MLSVSDLYREILEEPDHYKEIRAVIGLREQTVVNCSIIASVNESVAVGGTSARQLYLDIIPNGFISDSAPVSVSVRLSSKDGKRKSEWIPKGTYLIDTMSTDMETGVMSIFGFDFMMKTEQPFLQDGETASGWPKTPTQVMSRICAAIGVSLDSRTHLNDAFTVPFPTKKSLEDNAADSATNGPPYILNIDSKIIHRRSCRRVADIAPENTRRSDSAVTDLEAAGYRICRICRPSDGEPEPEIRRRFHRGGFGSDRIPGLPRLPSVRQRFGTRYQRVALHADRRREYRRHERRKLDRNGFQYSLSRSV